MSYTLYHGCIKSAVEPITHGEYGLEHGNNKIVHPWSCADGDTIFFHDATLMKKSECVYDDDNETAIQYCIERCNEAAQIQNACLPHPFDTTCVLEVTFYTDSLSILWMTFVFLMIVVLICLLLFVCGLILLISLWKKEELVSRFMNLNFSLNLLFVISQVLLLQIRSSIKNAFQRMGLKLVK